MYTREIVHELNSTPTEIDYSINSEAVVLWAHHCFVDTGQTSIIQLWASGTSPH
jgi:hypothetical protein